MPETSAASAAAVSVAPAPAVDQSPAPAKRTPLVAHPAPTALVALALAAIAWASYSTAARSALAAFLAVVLVVLAAVDLEWRIIPNRIVLPATAIVFVAHVAIDPGQTVELIAASLGAALVLLLPNLLNPAAIGMGDVKLALLLGAALGKGVIAALLVGFLATVPIAIVMLVRGGRGARKATLPLGPFLAFGGLVVLIVPRLF